MISGNQKVEPGAVSITRLAFDELPGELRQALGPRVERLGYLGEFFQCAAHQPRALMAFMDFTEVLRSALPLPLVEVVALTVGAVTRNDYERHQHERLCQTQGLGRDWVARVLALEPHGLEGASGVAQRLVLALLADHGHGAGAEMGAAVEALGEEAVVAILLLVGRYQAHSLVVNGLELSPPVPSIFEDGG